jgi:hypothetical protein
VTPAERQALLEKIENTKGKLDEARGELDAILRDIRRAPRAEKTTIGKVVQGAVASTQATRLSLAALEAMLASSSKKGGE